MSCVNWCLLLLVLQNVYCNPVDIVTSKDIVDIKANISALWNAYNELRNEVREKFDIHVAIENHEHQVHHLGHEDNDHEIHHSEKHLNHLEQVHGRTAAGPAGIEPHRPHTPEEKELLRHEHEVHHSNTSFETQEEHNAHHDEKMLKHLEIEHGHGEHNGVHHGKENAALSHELEVHFTGQNHDGHNDHHSENLLRHLEDDDGHGPALDRPKPATPKPESTSGRSKAVISSLQAICDMKPNRILRNNKHNIQGFINFIQPAGGPLTIKLNLKGFRSTGVSLHGIHVHEAVPTEEGNCNQAGAHYNPTGANHGGPTANIRHVGDFGNIEANQELKTTIIDYVASLDGPHSILNRTLVLHEKEDDLGLNPSNPESLLNGNAGKRIACCVIRSL